MILDEFDQMADGTLEVAEKRIASSSRGKIIVLSTPRHPEAGINGLFRQSDQRRYHLTCTVCGLVQALPWPDSVDADAGRIVCRDCHALLDTGRSGRWIAEAPGNSIRSYHLSRLYSPGSVCRQWSRRARRRLRWPSRSSTTRTLAVASVMIDANPGIHKLAEFAARQEDLVRVAWYNRHEGGFESVPPRDHRPAGYRLNRVEAIDHAFQRFHDGSAELPSDARALGGSVKRGLSEYYRELVALQRTLEQDAQRNWQARWIDRGQADHFAHAEVYCLYAEQAVPYELTGFGAANADLGRPSPWGDTGQRPWHVM